MNKNEKKMRGDIAKGAYVGPNRKVVEKLKALINEHFREERDVSAYAMMLDVTIPQLNRCTLFYLKKTVHQLIEQQVHDEALMLLTQSDLKVKEIANVLGLSDPSWFARCFKKYEGCSPKEYKKRLKGIKLDVFTV